MKVKFTTTCSVEVEHIDQQTKPKHVETCFALDVSSNLDVSKYVDEDSVITAVGSQVVTQTFVQGLLGNIHMAHQRGYRDSADHLRYVISELERGFIQVVKINQGHMN